MSTNFSYKLSPKIPQKLQQIERTIRTGARLVRQAAIDMDDRCRVGLGEQGRTGTPPPLSGMTTKIYQQAGEPDGSGIVNHLTLDFRVGVHSYTAILGIPDGQPTMIARVQNDGCTIPVTDKMRGFLAAEYGIYLKASTKHIVIPPRHFWDNALATTQQELKANLRSAFAELSQDRPPGIRID